MNKLIVYVFIHLLTFRRPKVFLFSPIVSNAIGMASLRMFVSSVSDENWDAEEGLDDTCVSWCV